jgi:predicted aconitase/predicted aconitase with swiveling domain
VDKVIDGRILADGAAEGPLLHAEEGLSFWGGVDPASGMVIDRHHPLSGTSLAGCVLAIPSGRGSCSGSGVLLELILNGHAPAAIIVCEKEEILTLGALVAALVFERDLPVLRIGRDAFRHLGDYRHARIEGTRLRLFDTMPQEDWRPEATPRQAENPTTTVHLDENDAALLAGRDGKAAEIAMRLLLRMAELQGADRLVDVSQVHIDGCIYTGPASLRFARLMVEWGGRVRIPTTLNAVSVDQRRWRDQGIEPSLGLPATVLAEAYLAMGARPSFTCAPYLLESTPGFGQQIGWSESNAVVYANSVIGARTMKYPDYLDLCIALTGRVPLAGCHVDEGRQATLAIEVMRPEAFDESFWPLLGYCVGSMSGSEIPLILGLETIEVDSDALKAFGAAFATMAAAPMFHIAGITPEAAGQNPARRLRIGTAELRQAWEVLNTAPAPEIDLVCLGNPHFSLTECARLAALVRGRTRAPAVAVVVTCGRAVHEAASRAGYVAAAEAFGVTFVTDTCWCMLGEPIVPPTTRTIMTNSGKYAHYAPGLVGRPVRFGSLAACIETACTGSSVRQPPAWLETDA